MNGRVIGGTDAATGDRLNARQIEAMEREGGASKEADATAADMPSIMQEISKSNHEVVRILQKLTRP